MPTFKKLQRRHRAGPSEFRKAQEAEKVAKTEELEEKVQKRKSRKLSRIGSKPLTELQVGEQLTGVVRNLVRHGAYVDVGAIKDGLVHVRDMAVDFVHEPRDVVRTGDRVSVWVKYVDAVKKVVGLTMVKPHMGFEKRTKVTEVEVGSRVKGIVERVTNYGAYVDIGAERLGFVHVGALWGERPRETLDYMRLGQRIWVHISRVEKETSHIRLIARGVDDEPLTEDNELGKILVEKRKVIMNGEHSWMALARPGEVDAEQVRERLDRMKKEDVVSDAASDATASSTNDEFDLIEKEFETARKDGGKHLEDGVYEEELEEDEIKNILDEWKKSQGVLEDGVPS